jgi:arabinogalactan oligomer/maltooligosaccharide transport system substrate-binding protein
VREAAAVPVGSAGVADATFAMYSSAGGYLFGTKSNGEPDLSDLGMAKPGAVAAFSKIASLGAGGSGALKRSIGPESALMTFVTSGTPFLMAGPEALLEIRRAGLGYDIQPVPGFFGDRAAQPFVEVPAFFVAHKGRNRAAAQRFVSTYLTRGGLPKALYEAVPVPPALTVTFDQVKQHDEDARKLLDAGRNGVAPPRVPRLGGLLAPFARAEAEVVDGADVAATVSAAAAAMTATLQ